MPQGRYSDADVIAEPVSGRYSEADIDDPRLSKGPGEPAHVGGFLPDRETARKTLPALLGTAAAMATGGATLPLWAAAGIPAVAGAAGSAIGDVANDEAVDPRRAAVEAAWQGGPSLVGAGLSALRKPLQSVGTKLWQYAAGGGSQKAAREVLAEGAGPLTRGNLTRLEVPRSPTGAYLPRDTSKPALEAMRSGVERASTSGVVTPADLLSGALGGGAFYGGHPVLAGAIGAAKVASKPLPASYLAQGAYSTGRALPGIGRNAPDLIRQAIIAKLLGEGASQ